MAKKLALIAVCLGTFLIGIGIYMVWPSSPESKPITTVPTASDQATSRSNIFTVSANKPWTDTGIDVTGKTVTIRAVSGCWDNGGNNPQENCGEGLGTYPETVMPKAPIGELIAKTEGSFHSIGSSGSISNARGTLSLGMNDVPGTYKDNHGSITVEVTIR